MYMPLWKVELLLDDTIATGYLTKQRKARHSITQLPLSDKDMSKQAVNLIEYAESIRITAKTLLDQARASGQNVLLNSSAVVKKIPELSALPKDLIVFRLRPGKGKDTNNYVETLCVFVDNDAVGVYSGNYDLLNEFEILTYQIDMGKNCHALVKHRTIDLQLIINLIPSISYWKTANLLGVLTGSGQPPSQYVYELPRHTIPLRDLPVGVDFFCCQGYW